MQNLKKIIILAQQKVEKISKITMYILKLFFFFSKKIIIRIYNYK